MNRGLDVRTRDGPLLSARQTFLASFYTRPCVYYLSMLNEYFRCYFLEDATLFGVFIDKYLTIYIQPVQYSPFDAGTRVLVFRIHVARPALSEGGLT